VSRKEGRREGEGREEVGGGREIEEWGKEKRGRGDRGREK
jgi:hypothetical protein